ncbi:GNAT family N-acetyltransferase [Bacillus velezensis]|uniref:GNAT family N-acetyltransferase n=1 Tax=Bacillus velezensis TaxID=492670 RepID=UPI00064C5ECC|nr:GNAT family N-acetyltransferase [Bacillus velezensis]AKL75321.1 GNAT family acetyltransferase [Bacillus velezensis]MEC2167680.1 GNAT family N-acetyltransferase [Bacillus velezensis]TNU57433.1 GNAT family N-acetyltransferase [Bacillus velezensis]
MTPFTITEEKAGAFRVTSARKDDAKEVMDLLMQAAEWLRDKGSNQWSGLLQGEDTHNMREAIAQGYVFLFRQNEELAGVVMLLPEASGWDRRLWGDEGHEESVYLHRLAINRRFAGAGLGRTIMTWAETGVSCPGKTKIRLDCVSENKALQSFYSGMGYESKGPAPGYHLFEKKVSK